MEHDQPLEGNATASQVKSERIRQGASDEPRRQSKKKFDRRYALNHTGQEALAQYLSAPRSLRKFRSDIEFAKHFHVTRMTVYRWKQDPDVIERAYWLSACNQMIGDLSARQEWSKIMQKVVEMAIKGNMNAIKFCEARAWTEQLQLTRSRLSASVLVNDLLGLEECDGAEGVGEDNQRTEGDKR